MAALAAVALLAAGCGSSGGSSSGSSSTGSSSSSVSAANQLLDKYTARPTSITQTTPIKKAIPAGKKITFISCGVEACAIQGPILQQGAKTLGWTVTQVGTDGSPEKVQNAI
jgi:ribose transport system substrate-binding protein